MNVSVPRSGMEESTPLTFAMFVEPKRAWILPEAKNMSGFDKRMVQNMEERAIDADGAADADAERDDAHVLDAAVGKQPFEVVLHQDEDGRRCRRR